MLVKVFEVDTHYINYDDYEYKLGKSVTDWEEVTEEEYKLLKEAGHVVVRQIPPEEYKTTIAALVKDYKKKLAATQAAQQRYQEQEKIRQQKALERKLAKAKKLLEQHGS